jgi:DNA-binding CsgD family transcriptional regulator
MPRARIVPARTSILQSWYSIIKLCIAKCQHNVSSAGYAEPVPGFGGPMRFRHKQAGVLSLISSYFPRQTLLSVLDDSKVGVVICDRRFRYKALNQSAAEIHNVPINAHLGRSFQQVLGSFAEKVVPFWETVFDTGHPFTNLDVSGQLAKRPSIAHWVTNLFPLKDGSGQVRHVCGLVIEISPPPVPSSLTSSPTGKATSVTGSQPSNLVRRQRTPLSQRENEVLRLLAEGKSSKEISSVLVISARTVETYRARLMLKLDANSIVDLVRYAIRNHIITL